MLIVVIFEIFISLILLSISTDITKTKEEIEMLYHLMWRWYTNSDLEEEDDEDD